MHFKVFVEDQSGKAMLDIVLPKIIDKPHTFDVKAYGGIGRIPKNLKSNDDARKRLLLDQLPKLLRGHGKTFAGYSADYPAAVIVVCDLDNKCLKTFRQELLTVLNACDPKPETRFCIAIEEGEAWLLGDIPAIKAAYPNARDNILGSYENDSIRGTWELLANAVFSGGASELKNKGWQAVGTEKSVWSEKITPHMNVDKNDSPSFHYFREKVRGLAQATP